MVRQSWLSRSSSIPAYIHWQRSGVFQSDGMHKTPLWHPYSHFQSWEVHRNLPQMYRSGYLLLAEAIIFSEISTPKALTPAFLESSPSRRPFPSGNVQNIVSLLEHSFFNYLFFMGACVSALWSRIIFPRHLIIYFFETVPSFFPTSIPPNFYFLVSLVLYKHDYFLLGPVQRLVWCDDKIWEFITSPWEERSLLRYNIPIRTSSTSPDSIASKHCSASMRDSSA